MATSGNERNEAGPTIEGTPWLRIAARFVRIAGGEEGFEAAELQERADVWKASGGEEVPDADPLLHIERHNALWQVMREAAALYTERARLGWYVRGDERDALADPSPDEFDRLVRRYIAPGWPARFVVFPPAEVLPLDIRTRGDAMGAPLRNQHHDMRLRRLAMMYGRACEVLAERTAWERPIWRPSSWFDDYDTGELEKGWRRPGQSRAALRGRRSTKGMKFLEYEVRSVIARWPERSWAIDGMLKKLSSEGLSI